MKFRIAIAVALAAALAGCGGSAEGDANQATAETVADNMADDTANVSAGADAGAAAPLPAFDPDAIPGMARIENRGYVLRPKVWRNPNIPVCWDNPEPANQTEREWVRQAVQASWEAYSAVSFFGWSRCGPQAVGVRIRIADEGPRTLHLGNELNRKPGGMILNFTFGTWRRDCTETPAKRETCIRSVAVHEFGHALAFAHEQNSPDTQGECNRLRQGPNGNEMLTPWDPASVMNYCNPAYANNGQLSDLDKVSVRKVYGL